MSGRYLLDTNIIIALFGNETTVVNQLRDADAVFVPSFVIGELCYGARKSGSVQSNLAKVDDFIGDSQILSCDAETAKCYGDVKNKLRLKGQP
ncbi:MAG: PIN domain-containing protein [Cyanobacteria bacterium P01_C01_bin.89]